MKNEANIKGDSNVVIQGSKSSKINLQNQEAGSSKKKNYAIIGLIVAILGVIATIIIGWDNIINFFIK